MRSINLAKKFLLAKAIFILLAFGVSFLTLRTDYFASLYSGIISLSHMMSNGLLMLHKLLEAQFGISYVRVLYIDGQPVASYGFIWLIVCISISYILRLFLPGLSKNVLEKIKLFFIVTLSVFFSLAEMILILRCFDRMSVRQITLLIALGLNLMAAGVNWLYFNIYVAMSSYIIAQVVLLNLLITLMSHQLYFYLYCHDEEKLDINAVAGQGWLKELRYIFLFVLGLVFLYHFMFNITVSIDAFSLEKLNPITSIIISFFKTELAILYGSRETLMRLGHSDFVSIIMNTANFWNIISVSVILYTLFSFLKKTSIKLILTISLRGMMIAIIARITIFLIALSIY